MYKNITIGILVLIIIAGLGFAGYHAYLGTVPYAHDEEAMQASATTTASGGKLAARDIVWAITPTEDDAQGTPHAEISVSVEGKSYVVGTFPGVCKDIAVGGSIDSNGLLAGELSAVQCYWAGSGDEIGVFAHEDGGYDILVGEIGEPTAETPAFRGNFKVKFTEQS